jgi:hypothetical protein
MTTDNPDRPLSGDRPMAELERTLIAEYLQKHGHDLDSVHHLPPAEAHALLKDASIYASGKLEEVESRAHYLDDLHQ